MIAFILPFSVIVSFYVPFSCDLLSNFLPVLATLCQPAQAEAHSSPWLLGQCHVAFFFLHPDGAIL